MAFHRRPLLSRRGFVPERTGTRRRWPFPAHPRRKPSPGPAVPRAEQGWILLTNPSSGNCGSAPLAAAPPSTLQRRIVARVDRVREILLLVIGPELADVRI